MKRALIIGAAGFVGGYLIEHLKRDCGMSVYATKLAGEQISSQDAVVLNLDILDKAAIEELMFTVRPDYIFHLAAQSSVGVAWKNPGLTIDVNIKGSVNVLDALRDLYYKPRVLLIGSGEEYGHIELSEVPIKENNRLRPGNIYAATKACQNMIGNIYSKAYDMDIMSVRAFNHIGPAQAPMFVISDFCKQVAEIEKGLRPQVMMVGNLMAKRDFTDVRDVVRAYALLIEKGLSGETYNVGSGYAISIQDVLAIILSSTRIKIEVKTDPNKIRPVDVPIIEADITKLTEATGWKPEISLDRTIRETLDYWRAQV